MNKSRILLVIILIFSGLSFIVNTYRSGYNFSLPDSSFVLPPSLHEISGLTTIDSITVACIQDELGVVFFYNSRNHKIIRELEFATPGDYEGITRVNNDLYVLRSDGSIAEVLNFNSQKFVVNYYSTGIPLKNNEGLCYDELNHCLLIGCKSKPEGPDQDKRLIYAFDLKTKLLGKLPTYNISVSEVIKYAIAHNIPLPQKTRKNKGVAIQVPWLRLATSEIGIHPVTKNLYLLSAVDKILLVCNAKGQILDMESLDPIIFNKAEGITFFSNGDMLITNEGQERKPTLHRFNYRNDK